MSGDGMSTLITALTADGAITSSTLWGEVSAAAPLIITLFVFSFGYMVVRKLLNKGRKAKAGI